MGGRALIAGLGLAVAVVVGAVALALALVGAGDSDDAPTLERGLSFSGSPDPWTTDFSISSVPLDEIHRSGPARDAIPALDEPSFVAPGSERVSDREPVVSLEVNGDARAYPISILLWHELVNDTVGGRTRCQYVPGGGAHSTRGASPAVARDS